MSTAFKPSAYQQAFFDALADTNDSLIVNAVAGSGKTTSIIEGLSYLPQKKTILMLAFNKSIAEELSKKVPPGVEVATFHSVGYRAWMYYCGKGKVAVDSEKLWKIVRVEWSKKDRDIYGSFCVRMVGLGKNAGVGTYIQNDIPAVWEDLMLHFDVTPQSQDCDPVRAIQLCSELLASSISRNKFSVDFDDMLYAPLRERSTFKRYDLVFIDEAQDTNGVQRELLKRMVAPGGRLVAVGDPCQAIYGFRGADSEAMNKIMDEFVCNPLPLSISYRCAQSVVRAAQKYVPHIEAWEGADEGIVDKLSTYSVDDFNPADAVLCRNVAPLVDFAYGMISRGQGVNFLGRDIGQGLISLIKKMNASSLDELEVKLSQHRDREEARLRLRNQDSAIEALRDRVECLFVCIENLSENQRSIDALIGNIQELFAKKDGRLLTLSTVHKSKGQEWNRVFILDQWRMPSRYATQPWQQVQEQNLIYVAITRAKRHLTYINGKNWKT